MKVYASTVLEIARNEIGYHEKASNSQLDNPTANSGSNNWQKYGRDLHEAGYYNGNKNGYAWCDQFVDWCFLKACKGDKQKAEAVECQSGPYGAGVDWSKGYYEKQGRCDRNPRVGDQVFFGKGGEDHTGLLEVIDGNSITTIEGNKDNKVSRCHYKLSDSYVNSFGHPFYDEEPDPNTRYQTIEEVPEYGKATVQKMLDKDILIGKASGLDLSEDMLRILVMNDRAGIYD